MLTHTVLKSKRKSYTIVVKDGVVTIRAPLRATPKQIDEILEQKQRWITQKLEQHEAKRQRFEPLSDLSMIMVFGELQVNDLPTVKQVKKKLAKIAREYIAAELSKFGITAFKLSNARTKWGSCSSDNKLSFNWRMACLPPDLAQYIVIHEVCHLKYHNHSRFFWDEVSRYLPHWKVLRKHLKEYSKLTELYR